MKLWTCLICNQPAGETPLYVARHMFLAHGIARGILDTARQSHLEVSHFPTPINKRMRVTRHALEGRGDILEMSEISDQ